MFGGHVGNRYAAPEMPAQLIDGEDGVANQSKQRWRERLPRRACGPGALFVCRPSPHSRPRASPEAIVHGLQRKSIHAEGLGNKLLPS